MSEELQQLQEAADVLRTIPGLELIELSPSLAAMDADQLLNMPKDEYSALFTNLKNAQFISNLLVEKAKTLNMDLINAMPQANLERLCDNSQAIKIVNKIIFAPKDSNRVPDAVAEVVEEVVEAVAPEVQVEADPAEEAKAAELAAAQVVADRLVAEAAQAEADRLAAEAAQPKQKIIQEYQVRDSRGNPVGSPTHLEADTWEEMAGKIRNCHEHAVAALERWKNRKTLEAAEKRPAPIVLPTDDELLEAAKAVDTEKDPVKKLAALKKIASAQPLAAQKKAEELQSYIDGQNASVEFLRDHQHDYYNCQANTNQLLDYIKQHDLKWNRANMELAFQELEPKLAEIPRQPVPAAVAPASVQPVEPVVSVQPVVQPVQQVVAPANTVAVAATVVAPPTASAAVAAPTPVAPAVANNTPAAVVKIPASGIEPGSLHGARPSAASRPTGLTMQDVHKATAAQFNKWTKDPIYRAQLTKLGIKI